jgi:hypothetical protein
LYIWWKNEWNFRFRKIFCSNDGDYAGWLCILNNGNHLVSFPELILFSEYNPSFSFKNSVVPPWRKFNTFLISRQLRNVYSNFFPPRRLLLLLLVLFFSVSFLNENTIIVRDKKTTFSLHFYCGNCNFCRNFECFMAENFLSVAFKNCFSSATYWANWDKNARSMSRQFE